MPRFSVILLLSLLPFFSCDSSDPATETTVSDTGPFDTVSDTAQLLAPGVLSSELPEFATTWLPDENLLLFNRCNEDRSIIRIFGSRYKNGEWTTPAPLPFSAKADF